jgi:hypothetical protein
MHLGGEEMGSWQEVSESYWTVCWAWIFPYPCKKYRTVRRYCYHFSYVVHDCYVFFEKLVGCENGRKYEWWDACFGFFTNATTTSVRKCFAGPLEDKGPCDPEDAPEGVGGVDVGTFSGSYAMQARSAGGTAIAIASIAMILQVFMAQSPDIVPVVVMGIAGLIAGILAFFKRCGVGGFLAMIIAIIILILHFLSILTLDPIIIYLILLLLLGGLIAFFGAENCSSLENNEDD